MLLNLLLWALFGLLAGVVAKAILGKSPGASDAVGWLLTIVLGIAGALVGGWISSTLFRWDINSFSIGGFIVAVVGALLLLVLYGVITSARKSV
jgi:uncharacterized membrane protein YeaQ/YmgE (transglycosylase-associated protein family)